MRPEIVTCYFPETMCFQQLARHNEWIMDSLYNSKTWLVVDQVIIMN